MTTESSATAPSKAAFWTGWVLSIVPCLLLFMSATMKLSQSEAVVKGLGEGGYDPNTILPIGIAELASTILYLIPQTAVLGAILLTGYLGGATATHVAAGDGMFWSPVLVGVLVWLGLYLREPRLRVLVPWRK
jgi:hypothetical protein